MMKNKMMRAASILLVAVLLSTCAISGTFAKYVTTASGTDTARVAKWGITMSNNGSDTFLATYDAGHVKADGTDVIQPTGADDVVAPGTTSTVEYSADGTPETAYEISFAYSNVQEVFLGAGTYTYDAPYEGMTKEVTNAYYPIKYQVVLTTKLGDVTYDTAVQLDDYKYVESDSDAEDDNGNDTYTYPVVGKLDDALKQLLATKIAFEANEKCDVTVTINWNWAFEKGSVSDGLNQNAHIDDVCDTILGDLVAQKAGASVGLTTTAVEGMDKNYNLTVAYKFTMTATQID